MSVILLKERSHIMKFGPIFYSKISVISESTMSDEPILSVIQPITIDTMLSNNWVNNGLMS